jgi:gas vesicle protein
MRWGRYQSSKENDSNVGTAITFLLIGLGAGALAGLLLAPKSGKQLRRDLKRGYEDAKDTLEDWADEARDRVHDAAEMAGDLRDAARERTEPLRRAFTRG